MNILTRNQNLNFYARKKLNELNIIEPTINQIETMKTILTKTGIVVSDIIYSPSLSNQEITCLMLSIQGKHTSKIAKEMNVSESSIQTYKQRIREKLKCNTNEQVVYESIRYAYITPKDNS